MVSCAKMSLIFEKASSCSSFHTIVSYAHRDWLRVRGFLLVWLTNSYKNSPCQQNGEHLSGSLGGPY